MKHEEAILALQILLMILWVGLIITLLMGFDTLTFFEDGSFTGCLRIMECAK